MGSLAFAAAENPVETSLIFPKEISLEEMLRGKVIINDRSTEDPNVLRINPVRIIELVNSDNIDLAIAKIQESQARWQFYKSLTHFMPSVDGSLGIEEFQGGEVVIGPTPFDADRITQRHRLGISYEIHTGFKPVIDAYAYKMQLNGAHREFDRVHQKTLLEALSQYYTWLGSMQGVDTAHQSYQESLAQRRQDENRLRTGFGTRLEVEQSIVQESEQEQALLDAHTTQMMSGRMLSSLLNIPLRYQIEPSRPVLKETNLWHDDEATLQELFNLAQENRPDVKELNYRIKQAKAVFWSTVSDIAPKIQLNAYVGNIGPGTGDFRRQEFRSGRIQFDVLRYMGLEAITNIASERARIKEAILNKEKELNNIQDELAKAYYHWYSSRHRIQVSHKKLTSAQEAYRISQAREDTGVGIHLEVLDAQSQLSEARQSYFDAVRDYNIAQLKLLYETGQLTPDRLLLAYHEEGGDDMLQQPVTGPVETADQEKTNPKDTETELTPVSTPKDKPDEENTTPATDTPGPKPELSPVSAPKTKNQKEAAPIETPANDTLKEKPELSPVSAPEPDAAQQTETPGNFMAVLESKPEATPPELDKEKEQALQKSLQDALQQNFGQLF